jgi:hypothetical protein
MSTSGNTINPNTNLDVASTHHDQEKSAFYRHLTAYVLVNAGLAILNLTRNPGNLWFLWVVMGWGIGVFFHGLKAFGVIGPRHSRR